MRKCNTCLRSTFDTAKFCHHCGAKMIVETLDCPSCNHANNVHAKVCEKCAFDFFTPAPPPIPPTKKRSIFDDIIEDTSSETAEEPSEESLELEFLETPTIKEKPSDEPVQEEEIEDDILNFSFEKTDVEITSPNIQKENIVFEIIEEDTTPKEVLGEAVILETIQEEEEGADDDDTIETEIPAEELDLNTPPPVNDLFEKNPNDNIEQEIFEKFSVAFEKQIKTEQNAVKYNQYVDRFEASDFKLSFEFRVKQLAEEVQKIRLDSSNLLKNEDDLLERAFTELTDYFIIRYCDDLNDVSLSESILQYQNVSADNIDLSQMVLDYLDFDNEHERVHFDFIKMPVQRLKNASKSFLFPEKGEKIFFICDQTILGSGKEGFAMTEKAIYWKMQFESAERVYYRNLLEVEPQKNWLTINEMFFNANPSLNVKMLKLLKKIKTMF